MQPGKTGTYIIFSCFLLAALMPTVVAAASDDNDDLGVPLPYQKPVEILWQEKPKTQWNWNDWVDAGNDAKAKGNYKEAIDAFNYAELKILEQDPDRGGSVDVPEPDKELSKIESIKAATFDAWPGHQAEADTAKTKSASLLKEAESKPPVPQCLIATATFDSPLAPQVQQLREFRENNIYSTKSGTQFMTGFNVWYYSFSPVVANYIDQHPVTKPPMRIILTPLLGILSFSKMSYFALSSNPDIAVIVTGFIASTLIGMIYAFPVMFVLLLILRRVYPFTLNDSVIKILGVCAITGLALLIVGSLISLSPVLLIGSVLFIVSLVFLTAFVLSWVCLKRLDLLSENKNTG